MKSSIGEVHHKIMVRLIPEDDMALLAEMAIEEGRSLEAQARHAIHFSVLPLKIERERRARATGLAKRLIRVQATFLENNPEHSKALSHIAENIGLETAEPVHQWFCGDAEPTFSQVRAMATYFGCRYEWLRHEEGEMYE